MSGRNPSFRHSHQGFKPLNNSDMANNTQDIPLQTVVSHTPSHAPTVKDEQSEKSGLFHRGRRRVKKTDSKGIAYNPAHLPDEDDEKTALNRMGRFYSRVLNFSIITRYMIYVAPLALILAIPIILSSSGVIFKEKSGEKQLIGGKENGAQPKLFFIWIEIIWLSFWGCKIVAHFLPSVFEFLVGVVSPGVKKYMQLLAALEKPLSFVFWMIVNQVTYQVLIVQGKSLTDQPQWMQKVGSVLLALLVCTCVILAERLLIQLISISYHRKQFNGKIKESKRNIYLLGQMYDASRALFPAYCNEFAEEDYIIQDSLSFALGSKKNTIGHGRSGSRTPMRLMQNVGRIGDKVAGAFGTVAQEITGKKVFDPNSAHSIVLEALDHNKSAEALARRIWLSFVVEGKNDLDQEDMIEVMGPGRQKEAEECFGALDRDGNGDVSLEEMILTVTEFGRERKSINSSMHDVDQAINALDALLFTVVFVVCVFVIGEFVQTGCFHESLTPHSLLPQPQLPNYTRYVGHGFAFALLRLRRHLPGSPWFLHFSVRQAPVRHRRPRRHRHRSAHRGAHFPPLHRIQTRQQWQDCSDSEHCPEQPVGGEHHSKHGHERASFHLRCMGHVFRGYQRPEAGVDFLCPRSCQQPRFPSRD
jgi:hypothetical protein